STVAIDVLHTSRRAEGIGFYGLSNNIATAIGPTIALVIYGACKSYDLLFWLAFAVAFAGLVINSTLRLKTYAPKAVRQPLSWDRFLLLDGWSQGVCMVAYAFSYGVLSTYIAIYGKDELGITEGTGLFFMLLSLGLIFSRLVGSRTLRRGRVVENASAGVVISLFGYLLFAALHSPLGYYGAALIIGLGNGHMFPAFQTMFINLAPNERRGTANSTLLVSWDIGIGLGILVGGSVAEHLGYHAAFWVAWAVNVVGVLFFLSYARRHFLKNRLR
ncbi:MAG: MFS transporter, partial [Alistipes sp.]|nr:MFS transporter [Alistipes sp.]